MHEYTDEHNDLTIAGKADEAATLDEPECPPLFTHHGACELADEKRCRHADNTQNAQLFRLRKDCRADAKTGIHF